MQITGTTRVFFCIADPIDQVRAPEVFNAIFSRHGIDAVMVPLCVPAARLEATLRCALRIADGRRCVAVDSAQGSRRRDRRSSDCGGARGECGQRRAAQRGGRTRRRFVRRVGFTGLLDRAGIGYAGRRVLVLGAGGAASAVTTALAAAGVAEIALFDPDRPKAQQLAALLVRDFGIIANAVGSTIRRLRRDRQRVAARAETNRSRACRRRVDAEHAAVCDILMKNQPTPLVRAARSRGLVAEPGFDMLILQTPFYLDFSVTRSWRRRCVRTIRTCANCFSRLSCCRRRPAANPRESTICVVSANPENVR